MFTRALLAGAATVAFYNPNSKFSPLNIDVKSLAAEKYFQLTLPGHDKLHQDEKEIVLKAIAKNGEDSAGVLSDLLRQGSSGRNAALKIALDVMSKPRLLRIGGVEPSLALTEDEAQEILAAWQRNFPYLRSGLRNKLLPFFTIGAHKAAEELGSALSSYRGVPIKTHDSVEEELKSQAKKLKAETDRFFAESLLHKLEDERLMQSHSSPFPESIVPRGHAFSDMIHVK